MKSKELKKPTRSSINLLLLSIALIIFGSLSLIFITQMDLLPGWTWEGIRNQYYADVYADKVEDLNGDGISEIAFFVDIIEKHEGDEDVVYDTPKYGRITTCTGDTNT